MEWRGGSVCMAIYMYACTVLDFFIYCMGIQALCKVFHT